MEKITSFTKKNYWLSDYVSMQPILSWGVYFNTPHNFLLASKAKNQGAKEYISKLNPSVADDYIQRIPKIDNWIDIREDLIEKVYKHKYSQEKFKSHLIATGNLEIEFQGDDPFLHIKDGKGENFLGKTIMSIRSEYFKEMKKQQYAYDILLYPTLNSLFNLFDYKWHDENYVRYILNQILNILKYDYDIIERELSNLKDYDLQSLAKQHYNDVPMSFHTLKCIKKIVDFMKLKELISE